MKLVVLFLSMFLSMFLLSIALFSCKSMSLSQNTPENGAIPWSIGGNQEEVLICANSSKKVFTKQMLRSIEKHYKGEFVSLDAKTVDDLEAYKDKKKYRFILSYDIGRIGGVATPQIFDRLKNQTYYPKITASPGALGILSGYVINLEKQRLANTK